jgi:glycosyltransferase involved in cell wall biosynthesis
MATTGSRFLAGAAHVIFSTRLGMEKARRWLRTANGRVVPWPVDMPSADAAEASRSAFRERLGIPEEAPILLFVGRFHTVKRPLETVRAFCASAPPSAHLVMMGVDGDVLGRTVFESVPMPWRERVHVVNGRSSTELAAAYRAADGFVSLSFQENFGYAAADALAHGLPVILSPGHDLAYEMPGATAGRFECGWLLPDDSDAAARQAIAEWAALAAGGLNTESRLKAMGRRGQEWAADHLGRDRFRTSLQRLV